MMADKPTFYWDACMFYEWLGNESVSPQKRAGVRAILQDNEREGNVIVTSVISHLEVLPEKLDAKGVDDEADYMALFDAVKFVEIEVGTNVLLRAREIRDHYYRPADAAKGTKAKVVDLGDAIHLATASIYGATEFHTRDDDNKGVKVPLLGLYAMYGETRLCGKYDLPIVSPEDPQGDLYDEEAPKSAAGSEAV